METTNSKKKRKKLVYYVDPTSSNPLKSCSNEILTALNDMVCGSFIV